MMFNYKEYESFVILKKYLLNDKEIIEIPSTINGKPVTRIGEECFFNHPEIKTIQFPSALERIGNSSFEKCSGISELILPFSVTFIGINAFRECTGLRKVVLSPNLKVLNQGVFSYCRLLNTEFVIPNGLEIIRENAFFRSGYFKLVLPESIKKIGMGAFCHGPVVKTKLPKNDGWYIMWPYQETIIMKGGLYGKVTDYSLLSDKCGVLTVNLDDKITKVFFPSVDDNYKFFWNQSQACMEEYLIDGEVKSYYESWMVGLIEYNSFYKDGEFDNKETITKRKVSYEKTETDVKQSDSTLPSSLSGVYEKFKHESPDKVLIEMQLYILSLAESFRNGEITEEEFYVKTFIRGDFLDMILELYDDISINYYYNITESDMRGFVSAWKNWKDTGKIEYQKWMIRVINAKGNYLEAARWIFHVIDVLLIPIEKFTLIDPQLYKVPVQYVYCGKTVSLMIDDYIIMDEVKKFDELFCVGNSYHIRYRSGIEADITINSLKNNNYEGDGIIYGYMMTKQKITICEIEGRVRILFNKRTFSDYQIALGTFFNPVPHPDWNQYNKADIEWAFHREAEYKSLRLPYMLGMITKEQIFDNQFLFTQQSKKKGSIINLSEIISNNDM